MKQIIIILIASLSIVACSTTSSLSKSESSKFSVKADKIYYENNAVAKVGPMEYEYNYGKFQVEVSVIQYSSIYDDMTKKIAQYMAQRHPKAKIEVKIPRDDKRD